MSSPLPLAFGHVKVAPVAVFAVLDAVSRSHAQRPVALPRRRGDLGAGSGVRCDDAFAVDSVSGDGPRDSIFSVFMSFLSRTMRLRAPAKNNYDEYKLTNNVKVFNLNRNFVLKTESLNGQFKNGSMYTLNDIDLTIRNTNIVGKGLKLLNHGEYVKIFGKAKLTLKNNEK